MRLTQYDDELDALKDRKYDIGLSQKMQRSKTLAEKSLKFSEDEI